MDLNFFVAQKIHLSYLCFIYEDEDDIHFGSRRKAGVAGVVEERAAYQNSSAIVACSASKHLPMSTTSEDRQRVASRRPHTAPYVDFLIKATRIRKLRQQSEFMFPQPRRPGDPIVAPTWSNMGLRIGSTDCSPCENRPSHTLEPCGHTVCYDHFLQHSEDLPVRCAVCLKVSPFLHDLFPGRSLCVCLRTLLIFRLHACSPSLAAEHPARLPLRSPFSSDHTSLFPPTRHLLLT